MQPLPANTDWAKVVNRLRKQLLIERAIIAAVLIVLIGQWAYGYMSDSSYTIFADGKPVVTVENKKTAEGLQEEILGGVSANSEGVSFVQKIDVKRTPARQPLDRDSALAVLKHRLQVQADKWAILIDGQPYAAVDTKEQAGEVLELARQKYGRLAPNLLEEPSFKQSVTIQLQRVELSRWRRSPQEAVELLFAPDGKATSHVVKQGETASGIAAQYSMSLEGMSQLNPGKPLDRLQIGDRLRVGQGQSPLTVVVRDQSSRTESMPYKTESVTSVTLYTGKTFQMNPGRAGTREVTFAVTYENGVETGREIIEENIIRQPVPRRVAVGTKPRR